MNNSVRGVALAGTLLSLFAIILAALGAHLVDMNGLAEIWQTASIVHMFNAGSLIGLAALLAIRQSRLLKWGAWLIATGTVLFCGTIYVHVISGHLTSGVAPAGGLLMIGGWALAALAFLRKS